MKEFLCGKNRMPNWWKIGYVGTRTTQIDSLVIVSVSTTMNCFNILHALNQISYIHGHFIDLR